MGKAMAAWRAEVVRDLGGPAALSAGQLALVDVACRTKLLLDSVDAFLLSQSTVINRRTKSLIPLARERLALCDSLLRHLNTLGLYRVAAEVPSLASYLKAKQGKPNGSGS